jgi:hypothetical protein
VHLLGEVRPSYMKQTRRQQERGLRSHQANGEST